MTSAVGTNSLTSLASAAALFGGALLVGWICKQAENRTTAAPPATADLFLTSIDAPFPDQPDDLEVRIWLASALVEADSNRLGEIAARLAEIPELDEKAWHGLFSCWFEQDPAAAWAFVGERGTLRRIALEEWAALDPAAARAALESPSAGQWLRLVRGAARTDVVVAFHFLGEALGAGLEIDFDSSVPLYPLGMEPLQLAELARTDPLLAVEWAERFKQSSLLGAVLSGWHEHDPAEALAWLEQRPDRDRILFDLADYLDDIDVPYRPALADLLLNSLPPGNDRLEALQQVLESLGRVDPELAAKEAARVFPDPELRAEAIGKIASIVAETDFDKAWRILDQLDPSVQGIRRVDLPAIEVIDGERTRSVTAFSSYEWDLTSMRGLVSPAEVRSDLLQSLLDVDKEAAIRLMEKIPAEDFAGVGEDAFDTWQARDPEAPPSVWARIAGDALQEAPEEFARVVGDLPDGAARDAAARKVVELASRSDDPLPAAGWALAIRGEAERQAALEEVFQRLGADLRLARDEVTAESLRELVASSGVMPEPEKARWLERIDQEFTSP